MRYFLLNSKLIGSKDFTTTGASFALSDSINNYNYLIVALTLGSNSWSNTLVIPKTLGYDKHYVVTVYHGASYIFAVDVNFTSTACSFAKSTSTAAWDAVDKTLRIFGCMSI